MSYQDVMIARAMEAYRLRCKKLGIEPEQPCCARSDVEDQGGAKMVVLRSVNNTLAKYQYQEEQDRLKWVEIKSYDVICEDWDASIVELNNEEGEFATFEDARENALADLQGYIESCQATFNEIEQAQSYEEYSRK